MPLGDKQRDPQHSVGPDLVELPGRVAVTKEPDPAAQKGVDLLHDLLDRRGQPGPHRQEADAVSGVLRRLAGRPAGKIDQPAGPADRAGAHQPMVEPEEVEPLAPSTRCTIRVLAALGCNPRSASSTPSRASAAWACPRDRQTTSRSSAYRTNVPYAPRHARSSRCR